MTPEETSTALIAKSESFWRRGIEAYQGSHAFCGLQLDAAANRLYYAAFLSICAYAHKFRGMVVDSDNPDAHMIAQGLLQTFAHDDSNFSPFVGPYGKLKEARRVGDYEDVRVTSNQLDENSIIKLVNSMRCKFIDAARQTSDPYENIEFDIQKIFTSCQD